MAAEKVRLSRTVDFGPSSKFQLRFQCSLARWQLYKSMRRYRKGCTTLVIHEIGYIQGQGQRKKSGRCPKFIFFSIFTQKSEKIVFFQGQGHRLKRALFLYWAGAIVRVGGWLLQFAKSIIRAHQWLQRRTKPSAKRENSGVWGQSPQRGPLYVRSRSFGRFGPFVVFESCELLCWQLCWFWCVLCLRGWSILDAERLKNVCYANVSLRG